MFLSALPFLTFMVPHFFDQGAFSFCPNTLVILVDHHAYLRTSKEFIYSDAVWPAPKFGGEPQYSTSFSSTDPTNPA